MADFVVLHDGKAVPRDVRERVRDALANSLKKELSSGAFRAANAFFGSSSVMGLAARGAGDVKER